MVVGPGMSSVIAPGLAGSERQNTSGMTRGVNEECETVTINHLISVQVQALSTFPPSCTGTTATCSVIHSYSARQKEDAILCSKILCHFGRFWMILESNSTRQKAKKMLVRVLKGALGTSGDKF